MAKTDVVVIGGSAAGLTAAITSRRHYPGKSVLIVRKEKQVMIPCGIPYIFGTVHTPANDAISDAVLEKNGIELLIDEVTGIDADEHLLTTASGEKLGYEKLVLATGASPVKPPIPGIDKKNIFEVYKDVPHIQGMLDQLEKSSRLAVVGGGFIGVEFADECRKNRDIRITIVETLEHLLLLVFDKELCAVADSIMREHGVEVVTSRKVEKFLGEDTVTGLKLSDGKELPADMVIVGIGVAANTRLAEQAGLALGPTKAIEVNYYMQTSNKDIFACGDVVEKFSFFDGKPSLLKLASTATREARIAGANLFRLRRVNSGVIGVFSTALGDTAFALAGLTEYEARRKGYDVVVGTAESINRHPGGMPEANKLKLKLIFESGAGTLLGGEALGAKCGGEIINAVSGCIHQRMTAENLAVFPMGTHPALTASPIAYQLTNAAEMAIMKMNANRNA